MRQIGPVRVLMPAPIMPSRLTSSCVGAMPTALFATAGPRIDELVSSAIAQVTKFAATAEPEPALDAFGERSVSYGIAERAAESTPRAARRVLREIRFRENDCARVT